MVVFQTFFVNFLDICSVVKSRLPPVRHVTLNLIMEDRIVFLSDYLIALH